ncbi:hypothetical protein [Enterococcus diestrammenae]|uniref:hypothetical protein n=1 Tax=Enterococcus diestrammenae TaxID=1155073 RepID=UPI001958983C
MVKKKTITASVLVLLAIAAIGGGTYAYSQSVYQDKLATATTLNKESQKSLAKLSKKAIQLYADGNLKQGYLSAGIKEAEVTNLEKAVTAIKASKLKTADKELPVKSSTIKKTQTQLKTALQKIKAKLTTQTALNQLFEKTVLKGKKVNQKVAIKQETTEKDVTAILDQVKETPDDWTKEVATLAKEAQRQVKASTTASAKVTAFYDKKGKLKDNATRKAYTAAEKAVNALLEGTIKKDLLQKLAPVLKQITNTEKAEAKKAEVAQQAAEAKAEQEAAAQAEAQAQQDAAAQAEAQAQQDAAAQAEAQAQQDAATQAEAQAQQDAAAQAEAQAQQDAAAQAEAQAQRDAAAQAEAQAQQDAADQAEKQAQQDAAESKPEASNPTPSAPSGSGGNYDPFPNIAEEGDGIGWDLVP